jgi:hypothetical protein
MIYKKFVLFYPTSQLFCFILKGPTPIYSQRQPNMRCSHSGGYEEGIFYDSAMYSI